MPTRRYYANNAPQQTLSAQITNTATTLTVSSFSGWPTSYPFFATLELGTANEEIVSVTNITGGTATIVRGQDGSVAVSHLAGATFDFTVVRQDFDEANAHTSASAGVHGISGSVVGTSDVQTLSNKTIASPSITGTASTANESISGTLSVTGTSTLGVVNASGDVTCSGAGTGLAVTNNLTVGGTAAVTGAHTAASYTANGNGAVTGVLTPKTYTNEAAAGTQPAGSLVYLTAPTGTAFYAGLFRSLGGGSWVPVNNDSGWIVATLGSSWVSYDGGATYAVPQYRLLNGTVFVEGSMKSGTTGTTIFTLPAGMRPAKQLQVLCVSVTGTATLQVASTGAVSVVNYTTGGSNTTVSMDFSFPADQ